MNLNYHTKSFLNKTSTTFKNKEEVVNHKTNLIRGYFNFYLRTIVFINIVLIKHINA